MEVSITELSGYERSVLITKRADELLDQVGWHEEFRKIGKLALYRQTYMDVDQRSVYMAERKLVTGLRWLGRTITNSYILGETDTGEDENFALATEYRYLPYRDQLLVSGGFVERDEVESPPMGHFVAASKEHLERFWHLLSSAQQT